jgi:hypothetical protein
MKDLSQVLREKEWDVERVRKEIEALHFVIPLLAEDADWIEHGLASSPSVSQPHFRTLHPEITIIATARPKGTLHSQACGLQLESFALTLNPAPTQF